MRILVVEDEVKIAKAIKKGLELKGYAVDAVYDADSGLSYARDPDYDLVVLDRMLPGTIDGVELCRKVREEGGSVPILMLTARGTIGDKIEGLNSGADDKVKRGQNEIRLSSKEFALLEYLLSTQGRVVTKDMIINHVWDEDAYVLPNTVEVYMGYLRNKIDRPFPESQPLLHTLRGFGYKLEAQP